MSEQKLQEAAPPASAEHVSEESIEDQSSWGNPWSAVEAGWDGEEPSMPAAASTIPPASTDNVNGNAQNAGENTPCADTGTRADTETEGASPPPPPAVPPYAAASASPSSPSGSPALKAEDSTEDGEEKKGPDRPMTLMEHLGELRTRLMRSIIAVALAFSVCYSFAEFLFRELCRPVVEALPPGSKLIFTALPEAFFVHLQVGFVAAVFVASPYIFYQIWGFIAPGLYDEEKQHMVPVAICSAFFFIMGASFCYFVVFPFAFTFFVGYANESIAAMPSLSEYLGFALKLLIAFGLIFEMPLFALFLARMGIITATMMREVRRYAVLVIFIVAAILTPPDVVSQLLMATPMLILYECSIWVAAAFGKKRKVTTENEEEKQESPAA